MKSLLLVEDDRSLAETLCERLQKEGYSVLWSDSVLSASAKLSTDKFDLVILDVGLPDGSGFEIAKKLRGGEFSATNRSAPFIFLTAMTSAEYRLEGYELGAEEYIPKPFHLKELLLRVKHVLENHSAQPVLALQGREIDWDALEVRSDGKVIERLQVRDAMLLRLLVARSPAVVSRDEILDKIWGETNFPSSRTVDNAVVRLRQVLGEQNASRIRSVRSVGYQWE
jgi:DNA-binding response OmpR family regulator